MRSFRDKAQRELSAIRRIAKGAGGLTRGELNAILNKCDRLSVLVRKEAAAHKAIRATIRNNDQLS